MEFSTAIQLLKEFDYERNGKKDTIEFLKMIIIYLERGNKNV